MNIYFASGFHHRFVLREMALKLEEAGHKIVSRWIYLEERPERNSGQWQEFAQDIAEKDIEDLNKSDALVFDSNGVGEHGGAFWEVGYAYATGKEIYIVGEKISTFFYLDDICFVNSYEQLLHDYLDDER